ncbi:peptidoglycan/xylan/chitin deacetylase (PgdA/CDA1 family) [Actinoplanes tereljensis]|uniref:Polysaccharide deacetylase n=1 Tax=Paractinoplanes tereljensis TaxID=571912 RepID=A0A919NG39_9ACTN|nr:polysaccharide deacetylase [Actinoplanes tereljensis]GIF17828.1 polysaccharide deacetylase [Actinoplanes tereljensis]
MSWDWPDGKKVAVSFTFDVDAEAGWLGEGDSYARRLTILSEGRYGVVRGTPRILALFERYGIPCTFFVPGYTAEQHPGLVPALLEHGHEVAHHGYLHLRSDKATPSDQEAEIDRGLDALAKAGATDVTGYRSTSWELTPETFDLLLDRGFGYDSSCMGDDRPYLEEWGGRRILELPVHWSLDDWPRFGWNIDGGGNVADPAELRKCWSAEFTSALAEQRHTTYTMHPEVIGRPYRLAEVEALLAEMTARDDVWFARLDQVAAHVRPKLIP